MSPDPADGDTIPRVFHFVFGLRKQREQFHLVFYLCLRSCLEVNRPERICFYYHYLPYGRYWDLIRPHLTLVRVPLNRDLESHYGRLSGHHRYSYAHHADFIRVEKVLECGGVYADMDTLFVNPLPEHLYRKEFVIGRERDVFCPVRQVSRPSLCNAFFMGRKDARFLREWLAKMPEYFDGTWSNHSCYLPHEISEAHPDWVHVEPEVTFYRYMWTREGLADLFENVVTDHRDVCSIHLWNHLWWDRHRTEFSRFHHGLITERRIRDVDTTFNLIARRFLPDDGGTDLMRMMAYRGRDAWGRLAGIPDRVRHGFARRMASLRERLTR
jgi:hypothetical protein